ncbi:MAG: hypothetical protein AB1750_15065 [Chloroflexota bacterium]
MSSSGVSSFDLLGDIPSPQRALMRIFLRQVRMTAPEVEAAVANLPEEKRLNEDQLKEALAALVERGWLKRTEENGQVTYQIQQIR